MRYLTGVVNLLSALVILALLVLVLVQVARVKPEVVCSSDNEWVPGEVPYTQSTTCMQAGQPVTVVMVD